MPAGIGYSSLRMPRQGGMQPGRQPPLRLPGGTSSRPTNNSSLFGSHPTAPNAPAFTFDSQGQYHVNTAQLANIVRGPQQVYAHFPFTDRPYRPLRGGRPGNRMLQLPQMRQMANQQYYANAGGRGPGVSRQAALSMGASPAQARSAPGASRPVSSGLYPGIESLLRRRRGEVPSSVYAALLARGQQGRMLSMLR